MRYCDPFEISHLTRNYEILLYFNQIKQIKQVTSVQHRTDFGLVSSGFLAVVSKMFTPKMGLTAYQFLQWQIANKNAPLSIKKEKLLKMNSSVKNQCCFPDIHIILLY